MDLISGFKSELFRPLCTIVVPGSIAIGPWILAALLSSPASYDFLDAHDVTAAFIFTVLITAAGLLLENVGARIELSWDRRIQCVDGSHNAKWHDYLQLATRDEIVGQRYLRTIVTRMKFELALAPALVLGFSGLVYLNSVTIQWPWPSLFHWGMIVTALAAYLVWESYESAKVAAKTRCLVVQAVNRDTSKTVAVES
jgi:hypothetical protein